MLSQNGLRICCNSDDDGDDDDDCKDVFEDHELFQ